MVNVREQHRDSFYVTDAAELALNHASNDVAATAP